MFVSDTFYFNIELKIMFKVLNEPFKCMSKVEAESEIISHLSSIDCLLLVFTSLYCYNKFVGI